jgi:hypothetical protein
MTLKTKLTNLQNVAASSTATLVVPVGKNAPTWDRFRLTLAGGALQSHIAAIRGKINGRIFFEQAGGAADIIAYEDFKGITTEAAYVDLDFTEPNARNGAAEQLVSAIPGQLLQDLRFEIDLSAAFVGTITADAQYRPPTANVYVTKRLGAAQSFAAQGTDATPNIFYMPTGQSGGKIKRIYIHEVSGGTVSNVQIRIGNNVPFEATRAQIEHDQKRNKLVPQASLCVLDFVEDGNLSGLLDTSGIANAELRLSTTAGNSNFRVVYEFIDPINRL